MRRAALLVYTDQPPEADIASNASFTVITLASCTRTSSHDHSYVAVDSHILYNETLYSGAHGRITTPKSAQHYHLQNAFRGHICPTHCRSSTRASRETGSQVCFSWRLLGVRLVM